MFRQKRQSKQENGHTTGNVKQFSFVGNVLVIIVVVVIAIVVCGTAIWFGVAYMITFNSLRGEFNELGIWGNKRV